MDPSPRLQRPLASAFPTRSAGLGPEMLGFELLLPNGVTRAGWMTVPGGELSAGAVADPAKVRWSWELWPWPRAFVARLVCQWERRAWRDAWGVESDWCRHPPGEPWLPQEPGVVVSGPHRVWRVERVEGDQRVVVGLIEPRGLGFAVWQFGETRWAARADWRAAYHFRAVDDE